MYNSSKSIKNFGVILFLISLVVTAIGAISVWILAAIIKDKNIWQPTLIGLGFAVAIGGLLISLALYFMFTALSEIIYFLNVISENTEKQKNKNNKQHTIKSSVLKSKEQSKGIFVGTNDENGEIYYDINCPNCNSLLSFAKWQIEENPDTICPNCEHEFSLLKK